ncbi:MAG: helix-hairpin-helix domain-containing protein [Prevotellaceae bacterium]|jgi:DNA uptake protein ComE-like DNA-binding protein|nr:helix-hairpin-helix domain-containing protein [Prevotellaceae bacterium]
MRNWRIFVYFSYSQRIAVVALLVMIVAAIGVSQMAERFVSPPPIDNDSLFIAELHRFEQSLQALPRRTYQPFVPGDDHYLAPATPAGELFAFNPNTLDSAGFVKLGLKPFIARNICKFRLSGKVFHSADDFASVYGLRPNDFDRLRPYISIDEAHAAKLDSTNNFKNKKNDNKKRVPEVLHIELNTADTATLKQLPGIGKFYAELIVSYRRKLGGYSTPEQLLEIKRISPETYQHILPGLYVDTTQIVRIPVNTASIERMERHPYIAFTQAQAIYALRSKKGVLNAIVDLNDLKEFTPTQLQKLSPYLDFAIPESKSGNRRKRENRQ